MSGIMNMFVAAKTTIATAVDAFFNLTTLLLNTSSTNGAQNNTFLDSSTNNFTITRNGNTTQGTFTPFSQTGWSNLLGDSSTYLTIANNTVFKFGTGDFTVEGWFYLPALTGTYDPLFTIGDYSNGILMRYQAAGGANDSLYIGGTASDWAPATNFPLNRWNHVAIVKSGTGSSNVKVYVNGTSVLTVTSSYDLQPTGSVYIGAMAHSLADSFNGYVSNFRITKGGALYTSTFTPSTTALTTSVSSGTVSLLTSQSNRFIDNSSNAFAVTVNGTPSVQAFSPFAPTAAYDSAAVGGSGYFDGSGDSLTLPAGSAFAFGTGDFTVECWIYPANVTLNGYMIDARNSSQTSTWSFNFGYGGTAGELDWGHNGSIVVAAPNTTSVTKQAWNHVAYTRTGTTGSLYVNGVRIATATDSNNYSTSPTTSYIASRFSDNENYTGYISGMRVVKGTALYTGTSYTIPTAPPTAITNTVLLLNATNSGIYDSAAKNVLETVGNAQVSTTQAKWGTTSMYFDGGGDYLVGNSGARTLEFLTGDFTVECWIRFITVGNGQIITADPTSSSIYWQYYSSELQIGQVGVGAITTASWSPSANTWYHIAVTRSGTTVRQFVDGTQLGTNATSSVSLVNGQVKIGSGGAGDFNGYIDDLRVTKGFARYVANFSVPTAAFPLQ